MEERTIMLFSVLLLIVLHGGALAAEGADGGMSTVPMPRVDGFPPSGPGIGPGAEKAPGPGRLRLEIGGGTFYPVGRWADGFDSGLSLGAGFAVPTEGPIMLGGRFSRVELRMSDRGTIGWWSLDASVDYQLPLEIPPGDLFLAGGLGLLKATVEVGEGKESEWDVSSILGGGILLPVAGPYRVRGEGGWRRLFADANGFYLRGALVYDLP